MVSRQNIEGRPRPSGVLPTVQDGPAAGLADPTPTPVGPVSQGPRRPGSRRGGPGRPPRGDRPPLEETPPTGETPPYPPGKGPDEPVPISPPNIIPGGSRTGGGAGYRARTSNIARETTEEQTEAGRRGRFGQQQVERYGRTRPPGMLGGAQTEYGRRYGGGAGAPRWATSQGGGGYGTIPPPLAPPEPEAPVTPAEEAREPRRPRGRRPRTGRGRQG